MAPGIDESLLTAYALGELAGTERAAVAAYLAGNLEARRYVADIRDTANLLVDELARESFGGLTDLQHASIEQQLDNALRIPTVRNRPRRRRVSNFAIFSMSMAASLVIVGGIIIVILWGLWDLGALHIQPGQVGMQQHPRETVPQETPNFTRIPLPQMLHGTPETATGTPGKLPELPGSSRPEALTEATGGNPLPDEPWTVPQPDRTPWLPEHDEAQLPVLVGIQPHDHHDNVAPKVTVPLTHTGGHGTGSAPVVVKPPTPKSDNFSSYLNQHGDAPSHLVENQFVDTVKEPVSGFSAGVDTASYSNIRRFLTHGMLPPHDAVRIEEMLNYFPVRAAPAALPAAGEGPLVLQLEVGACPWRPERRLARVCLQARELPPVGRPPVNLVFVVDVSEAMRAEKTKLPLVKLAMRSIVGKLGARDRISIVSYAFETVTVLPPTAGDDKLTILSAIERLEFAGRSNGNQGIEIAYGQAIRGFIPGGVNRMIIATDGAWNIGVTERGQLDSIVRNQAHNNISLTVLGVGMKNLKDANLQKLAIAGNGSYAYIDTVDEGKKVLADQVNGALVAAARDVKVQIAFNPAAAQSYRLIGYERRVLSKDEIKSESTRGGELGAGQSVTALYEVIPVAKSPATRPAELLTATVTYADPITLAPQTLTARAEDRATPVPRTSVEFRFAAAVAEFGLLLRDSDYKGDYKPGTSWSTLLDRVHESTGVDETGYRKEFVKLIGIAKALSASH